MPRLRPIHWKKFENFLFSVGCEYKREKGDHRVYWKYGINRPIIVPRDTHLPAFIILNNIRTLGISREEYIEFIEKE